MAQHASPVGLRRVSTAGLNLDLGEGLTFFGKRLLKSGQRLQQIAANVGVQRFSGRYIEHMGAP